METSDSDFEGFKIMVNTFEGLALEIFEACHDPNKQTMLKKVQQAFTELKEQMASLSTEAEFSALFNEPE